MESFRCIGGVVCSAYTAYTHTEPRSSQDAFPHLLLFSGKVMSDSLQPCGLQHARLPCPSPPGLYLTLKNFFSFCIFLVALGLTAGRGLSLVVASRGHSTVGMCGLLTVMASLVAERRF